jgi:phosphatidylglycerophosphate synthase
VRARAALVTTRGDEATPDVRAPSAAALGAKPLDAWWTVLVVDPVALRILPRLAGVASVTPLRLTLAGAALTGGAVVAFATEHFIVGALLFQAGFFFDCLDGKLARIRGETSLLGAFLDQALDVLIRTGAFVALAFHAFPDSRIAPVLVASLVLVESWLRIYPAGRPTGDRSSLPGPLGRARAALATRRLVLLPATVDFEALALFLAPLTGSLDVIRVALVVALAGYAFYALLHVRRLVRA